MDTRRRIENLEKLIGTGSQEAQQFTDVLLSQGIITQEEYDQALSRAIQSGSSMTEILQALDGRSLELPSQRRKNLQEVSL